MNVRVKPEPGVYPTIYGPAVFYTCPNHPQAGAVCVLVVTEDDANFETPCCLECGYDLARPFDWDRV